MTLHTEKLVSVTSSTPQGMSEAERQRFGQFVASVQLRREFAT